jgi:hypothetical protein
MLEELKPDYGPWFKVNQLLLNCDEAVNDSATALGQISMPANQIAYISHMLCDEHILACFQSLFQRNSLLVSL